MADATLSSAIDTFLTGGALVQSTNGAASTPPLLLNGTIFTGGSATTTKPAHLIEPTGTTSTGWSTLGTAYGANMPTGFRGRYFDGQINGASKAYLEADSNGKTTLALNAFLFQGDFGGANRMRMGGSIGGFYFEPNNYMALGAGSYIGWTSSSNGPGNVAPDLIITRAAAACLQMGSDAAPVSNQHFKACNRITSDGGGANLTLSGGNGRGGAGGDLILASYTTAGSGVAGTLTTRWQLDAATGALLPGTTTTYNLGSAAAVLANVYSTDYYSGSTKVVGAQGATVADASGGAVVDAEARTAINDLLARVRAHGLIAT